MHIFRNSDQHDKKISFTTGTPSETIILSIVLFSVDFPCACCVVSISNKGDGISQGPVDQPAAPPLFTVSKDGISSPSVKTVTFLSRLNPLAIKSGMILLSYFLHFHLDVKAFSSPSYSISPPSFHFPVCVWLPLGFKFQTIVCLQLSICITPSFQSTSVFPIWL